MTYPGQGRSLTTYPGQRQKTKKDMVIECRSGYGYDQERCHMTERNGEGMV